MSHRLTDHLNVSAILVNVEVPDKMAAIDIMVDALASDGDVEDLEVVREAVKSREATMSTGVGKGVGLPHAKTGAVRRTRAVFAVLREPIDFGAFDGEPVRLLVMVVGPMDSRTQHVVLLSRISRILNHEPMRQALLNASKPSEVLSILNEAEATLIAN